MKCGNMGRIWIFVLMVAGSNMNALTEADAW